MLAPNEALAKTRLFITFAQTLAFCCLLIGSTDSAVGRLAEWWRYYHQKACSMFCLVHSRISGSLHGGEEPATWKSLLALETLLVLADSPHVLNRMHLNLQLWQSRQTPPPPQAHPLSFMVTALTPIWQHCPDQQGTNIYCNASVKKKQIVVNIFFIRLKFAFFKILIILKMSDL